MQAKHTALRSSRASSFWLAKRKEKLTWPKEVIQLDHEHDRLWGALSGMCTALAALGSDSEAGAAAIRLMTTVFPSGVTAIIHLPFVEQRETTNAWLNRVHGEFANDVAAIGASAIVQRLTDVNTRFGELLDRRHEQVDLTYAQVREDDEKGSMAFYRIVAMLIGREAENDRARERLLGPMLQQNGELAETFRRRRTVKDVDPTTGEVTEPPVES